MLFSESEILPNLTAVLRLYFHEALRVYADKMVCKEDIDLATKYINNGITSVFGEVSSDELNEQPLSFCHFGRGLEAEKEYAEISSIERMTEILTDGLSLYNESFAVMSLVLFSDAVEHVMRITRILEMPRGNCLLVGVGGSGKQSLSRLASFIVGFEVSQIVLRNNYGMADLIAHLATLYIKAGLKTLPVVFLMTDAQVNQQSGSIPR